MRVVQYVADRPTTVASNRGADAAQRSPPKLHARPASFGAGISHVQGDAGSIGCFVVKPGEDAWYILSACHVLALSGEARPGDTIVEPARPNEHAAPLAILTDFEPLKEDGAANAFDAAIARVASKTDVTAQFALIRIDPVPMDALAFQSVRKFGAGTGDTLGVVTKLHARTTLELGPRSYLFPDVIQVAGAGGPFSTGGDSGALVVDAQSSRPIGLVIGGDGAHSFVSPIRSVLQRFDVRLVAT